MSNRDFAKNLIDQVPDSKILYVIAYLQGVAVPDETPNAETIEAIEEVENMIRTGAGEHFAGSTSDFFAAIAEEQLMLKLNTSTKFKKDYKLCIKRGYDLALLQAAVDTLRIPAGTR